MEAIREIERNANVYIKTASARIKMKMLFLSFFMAEMASYNPSKRYNATNSARVFLSSHSEWKEMVPFFA